MEVTLRPESNENVVFRYSHPLKTLFKRGKFPAVKWGFYGDKLTKKNVSLEHLQAKSKGGRSALHNYVLASRDKNTARGNDDIREHFKEETAERYFDQFLNVKIKGFNGNHYLRMILATLQKLGIDISFYNLEDKIKNPPSRLDYMA